MVFKNHSFAIILATLGSRVFHWFKPASSQLARLQAPQSQLLQQTASFISYARCIFDLCIGLAACCTNCVVKCWSISCGAFYQNSTVAVGIQRLPRPHTVCGVHTS